MHRGRVSTLWPHVALSEKATYAHITLDLSLFPPCCQLNDDVHYRTSHLGTFMCHVSTSLYLSYGAVNI